MSASLVERTVKIAFLVAQGGAPAGVISAATTLLAQVTIRAMFLGRLRVAASVMFLIAAVAAGVAGRSMNRAFFKRPWVKTGAVRLDRRPPYSIG